MDLEPVDLEPWVAERVRANLARSNLCTTLGITLVELGAGRCVLRLPFAPAGQQQHGFMHAGAVTTTLDSACGYAALTTMGRDRDVLTVEFKVNLMAPAKGAWFDATGTVRRAGRTLQICTADLVAYAEDGTQLGTVAIMQTTMIAATTLSDPAPTSDSPPAE